jgi:hypothetical protein
MSASNNIVLPQTLNTAKIQITPLRVLDSGGKQAYMNYDGGQFYMQTPCCTLPYGMSTFDKAGPIKYSVELSLRGYDEPGNKIKAFYDAIQQLDEFMIDQGVKNSKTWFKSELPRDVIKAFYSPLIRFSMDKDGNRKPYPPTFKLQLRQRNGEFETKMFDDKRTPYSGIPMEELLAKGAQVTSIIQCGGVWFAGSKFGLTWKAHHIRVDVLPQSNRGFTFVDEEDDAPSASAPSAKPSSAPVEEEEEESEDEAFKAPAPEPVKSKPSVVAAVTAPAPADDDAEEAEDAEPVVVPKKPATIVKKKIPAKK